MSQVTCFTVEENVYNPGTYVISPVHDKFYLKYTTGSFSIICARLMNLSYAQYLRFCRDICGGTITGKGSMYPGVHFPKGERVQALCRLLDSRANLILFNREHPDYAEHEAYINKYKEGLNNVLNKRNSGEA